MQTIEFLPPQPPFTIEQVNAFAVFTAKRRAWGFLPSAPFAAVYVNVWLSHNTPNLQPWAEFDFRVRSEQSPVDLIFSESETRKDNRRWHEQIWLPATPNVSPVGGRDLLQQFFGKSASRLTCAEKLPHHANVRVSRAVQWRSVEYPRHCPAVGLSFHFTQNGTTRQFIPCHLSLSNSQSQFTSVRCTPFRYAFSHGPTASKAIGANALCSVWLVFRAPSQDPTNDEISGLDLSFCGLEDARLNLTTCIASRYTILHEVSHGSSISPASHPSPTFLFSAFEPVYSRVIQMEPGATNEYSVRLSDSFFRTEAGLATIFLTTLLAVPSSYLVNSVSFRWPLMLASALAVMTLLFALIHVNSRTFSKRVAVIIDPQKH